MASLTFQIANMRIDPTKQYRRPQRDRHGNILPAAELSSSSQKAYKHHAIQFGLWCKEHYGCKTPEQCGEYIQNYAVALAARGMSTNTIHTYIAAVCRYWAVPMAEIQKPPRVNASNTKSRGAKAVDERHDAKRETSPRLYDFAERVGIRRREYLRLRGNDLVRDESGQLCVRVTRGKGGKFQLQRILPEDEEFVSSYFDGSDGYLFSRKEMTNKLDLHALRGAQARRAYEYYLNGIADPAFRDRLVKELQIRWENGNNKKRWRSELTKGKYNLRGANREFARAHGLPTGYDRLALLAVSVFHLSHWRHNVTVANYLLAV